MIYMKKTCMAIVNVFESGSVNGNYGAVTVLKGDTGHLTYGRSQTTLGSGNLYPLLKAYCEAPDAMHASEMKPYLNRVAVKDFTLDADAMFKSILKDAGHDPAMQREQDDFFERAFYKPSIAAAEANKLMQPLSQAVVYDSHIQGGWGVLARRVTGTIGPVSEHVTEQQWVAKFVETRNAFLSAGKPPLPSTTYRMQAFRNLMEAQNWDLALPVTVHGVSITTASFSSGPPMPVVRVAVPEPEVDSHTVLTPKIPYPKGPEVLELQRLLNASGLRNSQDQVYGPFTQALVKQFQGSKGLKADAVVGPQTWTLLAAASVAAS